MSGLTPCRARETHHRPLLLLGKTNFQLIHGICHRIVDISFLWLVRLSR